MDTYTVLITLEYHLIPYKNRHILTIVMIIQHTQYKEEARDRK